MMYLIVVFYLLLLLLYKLTAAIAYSGHRVKGEVFHEWTVFSFYLPWYAAVFVPLIFYAFFPLELNYLITVPASLLFLTAVVIRYVAFRELKELSYPHIRVKKDHELIKTGLYKYVRHPVYLGYLIAVFSAPLILNFYIGLIFSFLFLPGLYTRIRMEEEVLTKHVRGYKKYVKETYKLVPYVW